MSDEKKAIKNAIEMMTEPQLDCLIESFPLLALKYGHKKMSEKQIKRMKEKDPWGTYRYFPEQYSDGDFEDLVEGNPKFMLEFALHAMNERQLNYCVAEFKKKFRNRKGT